MKIAVVYQSVTGNTKKVANHIAAALPETVYVGTPDAAPVDCDLYFVGSWTDKGDCAKEIAVFLSSLQGKKVALFGTAGFGGSVQYYDQLIERFQKHLPDTCVCLGGWLCQGEMPEAVKSRYVSLLQAHPEDQKIKASLENFEAAKGHPSQEDLSQAEAWAKEKAAQL